MEGKYYSSERSVQLLISLLKQHNIKKCVLSPGATNLTFVASLQQDPYFECYSSVDERSAAYIACGLAAESGEPVVLSCTGATASRNYIPGLTEAYYRKLPVLAVTSTQDISRIGHHIAQVIDRRVIQNDIALLSEYIPVTDSNTNAWSNTVKINRALLELRHRGGGPVHLNVETAYSRDYSVKELPQARMIRRVMPQDVFPELPKGRIAVVIGAHQKFTDTETAFLDAFCATYDAVVFTDHTSGYKGKYRVLISILSSQAKDYCSLTSMDLLIHIGDVSGGNIGMRPHAVWRVNPDGELRDTYRKLTYVFEMEEQAFFEHYADTASLERHGYLDACRKELKAIWAKVLENVLPFSNVWIAHETAHRIPADSVLFLGILNTLRTWNYFDIPESVYGYANTGGFGIDGYISSFMGASLAHPGKLYFCVAGDLAFFYDMNVLGNRHVGRNIRILLINNGKGTEFRNYNHPGAAFGEETDKYIAAAGHFGNKSHQLVRHYAEDLGYEYLSANNKEEYLEYLDRFLTPGLTDRPMLFEVFTDNKDESDAIRMVRNLNVSIKGILVDTVKSMVGEKGKEVIKGLLGK
ncbi:thiamine pyrophosphate-binding protein [Parabacteroides distasonis]|uniref:2-succinyl-5-enolpyruvyl-6-hydroxy-3-cyclohexene-1-carboxylate synthase n=1 Tax=Parabacteroides distasonis TaxID=823 RepID=A0A4S2EJG5_PARDI|nr:thiamine pyrophosphate-binding protein [Parabacteroides distasonis]TGY56188.1 2-succinyl-5-enolpyruvyl-6-hydroxy-3-cyclohexene-1-carboxylate synthase [Parabacteroides distasonis]